MTALIINVFLVSMLMLLAGMVLMTRRIFAAIILTGAYSLIAASVFVNLQAVDVAFTEAAVGAGIATVLLLAAAARLPRFEKEGSHMRIPALFPLGIVLIAGALLIFAVIELPALGDPGAVAHNYVAPRYLSESIEVLKIPNVVTTVLASYRGFDTLGEVIVVFAAGLGVVLMLGDVRRQPKRRKSKTATASNKPKGRAAR